MRLLLIYFGERTRKVGGSEGERRGREVGRTKKVRPGISPITPVCLNSFVIRAISSGYLCAFKGRGGVTRICLSLAFSSTSASTDSTRVLILVLLMPPLPLIV